MRGADSVSNGRRRLPPAPIIWSHTSGIKLAAEDKCAAALPRPGQIVGEIMVQIIQRVGGGLLVCINIDYSCHVKTEYNNI